MAPFGVFIILAALNLTSSLDLGNLNLENLSLGNLNLENLNFKNLNPLSLLSGKRTLSPESFITDFVKTTARNGYLSELHEIVTEDGYILPMFRIVEARNCTGPKRNPPVILMHGLLLSSDAFFDAGPDAAPAYLLADECYDVWVGNERGNYYARRHVRLNPDKDKEFWQFSVDEIGLYDIPATIDYVLEKTGVKKVNYIGYSQGAGTFFIMCSERPGYCDKVQLLIGLAPATRHLNAKSPAFVGITEAVNKFYNVLTGLGIVELFTIGGPFQVIMQSLCEYATRTRLCASIPVEFEHYGSITPTALRVIRSHFPAGTSTQNLARYGQSQTSVNFVKFDYGAAKNLDLYGSPKPPAYNLSAVSVPVVILYGTNDGIVDVQDIYYLARRLPNVLEVFQVTDPLWNHFDMVYSQYVPQRTFPKIVEYLNEYSYQSFGRDQVRGLSTRK